MSQNDNSLKDQTKLEAFRQHWEQIRHDENQRLTFTNFYALIVGGVLAYIFRSGGGDYRILFIVLCVLSLFGMALCLRLTYALEGHKNRASSLAAELTGESKDEELEKYIPLWKPHKKWQKVFSLRWLFPILYGTGFAFFLLLALGVLPFVNN